MTRRWTVRPFAQADLDDAATWYESQQSALGSRFLDAVDHVLNRVRETPLQFPSVSAGVRRVSLQTFPYAVYFREWERRDIRVGGRSLTLRRYGGQLVRIARARSACALA